MTRQSFYFTLGWICLILTIGIVGGIEQGAPLSNFVYAFAAIIGCGVSFYKAGAME